jgi:hypothetical protein
MTPTSRVARRGAWTICRRPERAEAVSKTPIIGRFVIPSAARDLHLAAGTAPEVQIPSMRPVLSSFLVSGRPLPAGALENERAAFVCCP